MTSVQLLVQDIYLSCYVDRTNIQESWADIGGLDAAKAELVSPTDQASYLDSMSSPKGSIKTLCCSWKLDTTCY